MTRAFAAFIAVLLLLGGSGLARAQPLNYQDLWWAGSQENGWGLSISQQGSALFTVLYVYDSAGRAQWVVMPDARWNASFNSVTGALYVPSGSSFASYDASRFAVGASVGTATIDFAGTNKATLRYTLNGASGTKSITRQTFGVGAALGNYTDLWWGGTSQNGWGISITQQGSDFFAVWYTYDAQGRASWMVMPAGRANLGSTVNGTLYRTTSAPWAGVAYDPARLTVTPVGSMAFSFTSNSAASLRYVVDGVEGTVALTRQPFGQAVDTPTSSFAKLQQRVIAPQCLSCHTAGNAFAVQSGLVLDPAVAYRNLVNVATKDPAASALGMSRLVTPRDVTNSFLHRKLLLWDPAQPQTLGSAMPLGTTSLSAGQIEFIKRWIEAGAPEEGEVADATLLDDTTLPAYAPFAPLAPPPPGRGFQIKVDPFSVTPNFERELFVYRGIGNASTIYVTRFETRMRTNSHHLVLYGFVEATPLFAMPNKDVVRDIRNLDGTMNIGNMIPMAYHVFVAGSMSPTGGFSFPPGVALPLPANGSLDFNVHYVNRGTAPIMGEAYANLYTVDSSQVQQVASTLNLSNTSLALPPMTRTTQTKTFTFNTTTRVLSLTSHMHKLGERFVIRISGGARNGEVVYESTDWEHPQIVTYASPIVLNAGEGLTSVITYNNTTNRAIAFGLTSEDEMGIIFGYTY